MLGDRRLQILAAAHVVLGVVTSVSAHVELRMPYGLEHILMVPFVASAFAKRSCSPFGERLRRRTLGYGWPG